MANLVSMKSLLEAGVHFGHQTRRWNPRMKQFIFTERNGIHIIDLQQTVNRLQAAYDFARDLAASGRDILFVGTKKQAQEAVQQEAERCGMPYVNARWLGGTLTNFQTISARIDHLIRLEEARERGEFERLPKKEVLKIEDEITRLNRYFAGIKNMRELPGALYVVDTPKEYIAVKEANRLKIPVVAMCDTNSDPDLIDYPIPANDDAIRAVRLMAAKIADAVVEGRTMRESAQGESFAAGEEFEGETPVEYSASPDDEENAAGVANQSEP